MQQRRQQKESLKNDIENLNQIIKNLVEIEKIQSAHLDKLHNYYWKRKWEVTRKILTQNEAIKDKEDMNWTL